MENFASQVTTSVSSNEENTPDKVEVPVDFKKLKTTNKDIYAWIKAADLYNGKMNLEYITNTVEYK